ncbi:MAG: trimethylamine methyltransferase family protein [Omnitrophica WOR_2 bacterium]
MMQLTVLDPNEIQSIHLATLRILSETGVVLKHPGGRQLLCDAKAATKGERVCFPPDLVEWALSQCLPAVTVSGRDGKTITLGDGSLHWHNLGGARDVYESRTGLCRPAVLQDVCDSARLLDALENATSITPFFTPRDVPGPLMSLSMYRYSLPNATKPVQGPGVQTAAEVKIAVEMAAVIGKPQEVLTLGISPVSPLNFPDDVVAAIIETARQGISLSPLPCPTAGTTGPISIAGVLAQQNAEILASIVLAQLVHPGLPVVYTGRIAMMEPRTGLSVWGGVELGLASAATVQLGHSYHLPVNVYGLSTNSTVFDIQNGYERALNAAIPALAGADELSGIGEMQAGVAGSYEQMVCDNEIAASVGRLRRGFTVDEDTLAVDVIAAVMDGARNFLGQRHTRRYLRAGEITLTRLANRSSWIEWERNGRAGMVEHAESEVERILKEHQPAPLTAGQDKELDTIMQAAGKMLVSGS